MSANLQSSRILASSPQIASAASISSTVISELEKCPSDTYIVVSQPGVNAADYADPSSAPYLRKRISGEDTRVRSSFTVADVLGEVDADRLVGAVETKCGASVLSVDASSESQPWNIPAGRNFPSIAIPKLLDTYPSRDITHRHYANSHP